MYYIGNKIAQRVQGLLPLTFRICFVHVRMKGAVDSYLVEGCFPSPMREVLNSDIENNEREQQCQNGRGRQFQIALTIVMVIFE